MGLEEEWGVTYVFWFNWHFSLGGRPQDGAHAQTGGRFLLTRMDVPP